MRSQRPLFALASSFAFVFVLAVSIVVHPFAWADDDGKRRGAPTASSGAPSQSGPKRTGSACIESRSTVDLDDQTSLGISAQDVLDTVAGDVDATLHWRDTSTLYATHAKAGQRTQLTFELSHDGKDVTFIESKRRKRCVKGKMGRPCRMCGSRFEIGVVVRLTTDDGSLADETFDATMISRGKGGRIRATAPVASVGGSLARDVIAKKGRTPTKIVLEASYGGPVPGAKHHDATSWNGFVAILLEGPAGSPVNVAHGYWP